VPRTALYIEKKQVLTFGLCVLGHTVILVLSLYWLRVMLSAGVRGLLEFRKARDRRHATLSLHITSHSVALQYNPHDEART